MTRKFQVWNYSEPYYQMYPDTWVCMVSNVYLLWLRNYFSVFELLEANNKQQCIYLTDDYGWEVCGEHMEFTKECDTGNTKEEQLGSLLWGTLSQCLYHGPPQTWWKTVHWIERGGHSASRDKGTNISNNLWMDVCTCCQVYVYNPLLSFIGQGRCPALITQWIPSDPQQCLDRPSN